MKTKQFSDLPSREQKAIIKLIKTDFPAAKALYERYLSNTETAIKSCKPDI